MASTDRSPYEVAVAITPSDTLGIVMSRPVRGIHVGGAGAIVGILQGDTATRTFSGLLAGNTYPFAFKQVYATGTTATNLLALG